VVKRRAEPTYARLTVLRFYESVSDGMSNRRYERCQVEIEQDRWAWDR